MFAQPNDAADNIAVGGGQLVTRRAIAASSHGLRYLVSQQSTGGAFGVGPYHGNVGVNALCGMALMSGGSTPGRGEYGENVQLVVEYLLSCAKPDGFIESPEGQASHGPMYGHGFATLFLAEAYGMSAEKELRPALKRAVDLIVASQNADGGWRYQPRPNEADISVTVCQIMALRAARNAGIAVPKETVDRCIRYVRRCQNRDGGYRYRLASRPESEFPRSAAGVVALYSAGIYEGDELRRGLHYVSRFLPHGRGQRYPTHYYYYGHYYAVQAMWHAGGDYWSRWYPAIRDQLILNQDTSSGSWSDRHVSSVYATAMACLVLNMPNDYLPIFQR